ncbi:hypothetical protein D3C71_19680 [compost metagenome]
MALIVEFGGRYLNWSTISNAPLTGLMTETELRRFIARDEGYQGLKELPRRLERVKEFGTSSMLGETNKSLLESNAAGPNGRTVKTVKKMVELYGDSSSGVERFELLDAAKPLVIKDHGGYDKVNWPVTEVVGVRDNMAFVVAKSGDNEFQLLVDLETGAIKNTGYQYLYAENVAE